MTSRYTYVVVDGRYEVNDRQRVVGTDGTKQAAIARAREHVREILNSAPRRYRSLIPASVCYRTGTWRIYDRLEDRECEVWINQISKV